MWGTCAGLILLARDAGREQQLLDLMDLRVARNAFGRQVESFEAELPIPALGEPAFPAVFIRAPKIEAAGADVDVLARLPDGTIVAAHQGNLLGTAFHPELTGDPRRHASFLAMAGVPRVEAAAEQREPGAPPADHRPDTAASAA